MVSQMALERRENAVAEIPGSHWASIVTHARFFRPATEKVNNADLSPELAHRRYEILTSECGFSALIVQRGWPSGLIISADQYLLYARDHCDRAAAGRSLMLSTARDVDGVGPCEPTDQPAHGGAGVTRGVDVGILEHGVTKTANEAIRRGLGLGKDVDQPTLRSRVERIEPDASDRVHHRRKIDRIAHHRMA